MKRQTKKRMTDTAIWAAAILTAVTSSTALLGLLVPALLAEGSTAAKCVAVYFTVVGVGTAAMAIWLAAMAVSTTRGGNGP